MHRSKYLTQQARSVDVETTLYERRVLAWKVVKEPTGHTLRKHAYSNILKFSSPKNSEFSDKNSDIILISAQNIDCGYS